MQQPDLLARVSAQAGEESPFPQKSPTALRTISEAAQEIGVEPHVLRFWETQFPQIKPLKRKAGRRYYRPADIEQLKEIKALLYKEGYTIKGAKQSMRKPQAGVESPPEAAPAMAAADAPSAVSDKSEKKALHGELSRLHSDLRGMRKKLANL
jgi:DNA-binding transcriptional MerR regulator